MTLFHQAYVSLSARNSKLSVLSLTHQEVKRDVSVCRETITPGALPAVLHPKNSYQIRLEIDALPRRRGCVVWREFLPLGATWTWSRKLPLALRVGETCWPGVSAQKHATQLAHCSTKKIISYGQFYDLSWPKQWISFISLRPKILILSRSHCITSGW